MCSALGHWECGSQAPAQDGRQLTRPSHTTPPVDAGTCSVWENMQDRAARAKPTNPCLMRCPAGTCAAAHARGQGAPPAWNGNSAGTEPPPNPKQLGRPRTRLSHKCGAPCRSVQELLGPGVVARSLLARMVWVQPSMRDPGSAVIRSCGDQPAKCTIA